MFGARLGVFVLFALSLGCEARLSLGSGCVRTSECTAPYACITGRCREECADHRDCTPPTRCVAGNDGLAVCTLPDERCTADADCGEDLVCRTGECFDACAGGSCPAGGVCTAGLCARPDGTDAGAPTDAGSGFPRRVGCTSDLDCGEGVCTRTLGSAYECRARCGTVGDCPAAPATVACGYFQSLTGGLVLACSLACDLFGEPSGCTPGTACDVFELTTDSVNAPVVDCRAVDSGAFGPGGECGRAGAWDPTICTAGLTCDGLDPYTCQELCTVTGVFGPACPGGTTCEDFGALDVRYQGARVGSCDPI